MIIKCVYIHLARPPSPFNRSIRIAILNFAQNLVALSVYYEYMLLIIQTLYTTTKHGLYGANRSLVIVK
jgi:hypothetical protein